MECREHPDQHCSRVCIHPECADNRIICAVCCFTTHAAHETQKLRKAMDNIEADLEVNPRILTLVASIDAFYNRFRKVLVPLYNTGVDRELKHFFESVSIEVKEYEKIRQTIIQSQGSLTKLSQSLKHYMFFKKFEENGKTNFQLFLEDIYSFLEEIFQELERELHKNPNLNKILGFMIPYGVQKVTSYRFSSNNIQSSILLSTNGLTVTQANNSNNNIALIEPLIEGNRRLRRKKSIKLKIQKGISLVGVGIAYANTLRKSSFQFATGTGHGAFLASYQGYFFHSDDESINEDIQAFRFVTGDVITVTVNTIAQVIFSKDNGETLKMPYKRREREDLHFCVWVRNPGQSVTILN